MGIINTSPDSFYEASRKIQQEDIAAQAGQMLAEGADILDIGGYSSRPGAKNISVQEELDRVIPAITSIKNKYPEATISIDTFRAKVAQEAVNAGAAIINDISGGQLDEAMFATVAKLKVPYIIMHMRGTPQNMQQHTYYKNIVEDIVDFFAVRLNQLRMLGVKDIVVDPGFGFAKTPEQNFKLLKNLAAFRVLQAPVLVGLSRKSTIYKTLNITAAEALNGTTVLNTLALMQGTAILRVHDVKAAKEAITLVTKTLG